MENLMGKSVIGDCGCMFPQRTGVIFGEILHEMFGDYWVIQWDGGKAEPSPKRSVKPISQIRGAGVYYE